MSQVKQKLSQKFHPQPSKLSHDINNCQQEMIPLLKVKNNGHKRTIQSQQQKSLFSMGFKKQEVALVNQPVILVSMKDLLKQLEMNEILDKCPKVKQFYEILCTKLVKQDKLIYNCLDKYFHGNVTSLWINKYAPRISNQLFQIEFSEKIEQWIKDFYYFRKEDNEYDDQLQQSSYSKSLQCRMKQNGWNCKALILKGRTGVGKTSFLNAIAKSMNIRCFQYASDVDQLLKLKQLIEGSQSQVITNITNKKKQVQNNKIIKQNNPITKFIPPIQYKSSLETKQPKRLQLFRNFSLYYPSLEKLDRQNAEDSYLRCLFDKINKSQIPYILTSNRYQFSFREKQMSEKFGKFDQIQFVQNSVEELTYLFWIVYQIEINFCINTTKKIKKQLLIQQLNNQLNPITLTYQDNIDLIRQLIISSNKKLLYISKYLQFKTLIPRGKALIDEGEQNHNNCQVIQQCIHDIGYQIISNITSQDLIYNIDWKLYQRNHEDGNPLKQTAEDSDKNSKIFQKEIKIDQEIPGKQPNIKFLKQIFEINVATDKKVFQSQYYQQQPTKIDTKHITSSDPFTSIPTKTHIWAKKHILSTIKSKLSTKYETHIGSQLTIKQLYYLPLLFMNRRSSRHIKKTSKDTLEEHLHKIMNQREYQYMRKFGKLFFPGSG